MRWTLTPPAISGLGHLGLQFAHAMGYRAVALSGSSAKQALAFKHGADAYIDGSKEDQGEALARMGGAKVITCTAPSGEAVQGLLRGLAPGGQLLILGVVPDTTLFLGASFCLTIRARKKVLTREMGVQARLSGSGCPSSGSLEEFRRTLRMLWRSRV